MENIDLNYLALTMANLCGMPCRIYTDNLKTDFFSLVNFPRDPAELIEKELFKYQSHIGYLYDENFFYYGYINYQNKKILLGPTRIVKADKQLLAKVVLLLNISKDEATSFISAMNSLVPMPLESLMLALSSLNYILNHEQLLLNEIMRVDEGKNVSQKIQEKNVENKLAYNDINSEHNTYDIEKGLMHMIELGQSDKLKDWIKNAPAVSGGIVSNDALRQMKNTFIATATLASRSAINGGLDISEALSMSDLYIQKMETFKDYESISSLQVTMLLDYATHVNKIRGDNPRSAFLIKLNEYIKSHISEAIKSKDVCANLYFSKSQLFSKIKKETGKTFSEYILSYKVNESKELLTFSNHSISSISLYLGFSSQAHFNKVFKLFTNTTPMNYRKEHQA